MTGTASAAVKQGVQEIVITDVAKSLLGYKLQNSPLGWLQGGLKIIPDQMVIPYPTFDLFWMLFQKTTRSEP